MRPSNASPEALDHAWGDASPSHHAEHPNATDATERRLRYGRAAPGSLTLVHDLLSFWTFWNGLLDNPVSLHTAAKTNPSDVEQTKMNITQRCST